MLWYHMVRCDMLRRDATSYVVLPCHMACYAVLHDPAKRVAREKKLSALDALPQTPCRRGEKCLMDNVPTTIMTHTHTFCTTIG